MQYISYITIAFLVFMPVIARAELDVTVSPRIWYLYDSLSEGEGESQTNERGDTEEISVSSEPFDILLTGLSIGFHSSEILPNTTFILTGLYGTDEENISARGSSILNCNQEVGCLPPNELPDTDATDQRLRTSFNETEQDLERIDLEFVAQTRVNDLLSWVAGMRWEHARIDTKSTLRIEQNRLSFQGSQNPEIPGTEIEVFEFERVGREAQGYDLVSMRGGVSGVVPITKDSTQMLYSSMLGFIGYRFENNDVNKLFDDAPFAGPDISVGYLWSPKSNVSVDFRYRVLVFYPLDSDGGDVDDPKTTHGPGLGVNIRF